MADLAGRCYGRAEVALADTFAEEARAVLAALPWAPREVWTSPALRCVALAEMLAGGAPVRVESRLQELSFGAWEGRRWETFRGPESEAWALDPWGRRPPGGETAAELWARVETLRAELLAGEHDRLVLVTHAGVIRAWRGLMTGRPPGELWSDPVEFGGLENAFAAQAVRGATKGNIVSKFL